MNSSIPLLLTADVEIAPDYDYGQQATVLDKLHGALGTLPVTWFCTAAAAETFSAPLRRLLAQGHAIGCHGLDHGLWEDYRRLGEMQVQHTLTQATARIEAAVGIRPRLFRGPRMTTSQASHRALRCLDYVADFSVCTRRFDAFAASCYDARWMLARPTPYRARGNDPFVPSGT